MTLGAFIEQLTVLRNQAPAATPVWVGIPSTVPEEWIVDIYPLANVIQSLPAEKTLVIFLSLISDQEQTPLLDDLAELLPHDFGAPK